MKRSIWKQTFTALRRRSAIVAAGSVVFALGGAVLLRAPAQAGVDTSATPFMNTSNGEVVHIEGPALTGTAALSQSAVVAAGEQTLLAEVNLRAAGEGTHARSPVAIAVVLDTSGSMQGDKIRQAQSALTQLVERMADDDMVAIVTYDHATTVRHGLARVSEVRSQISTIASAIWASGGTVIPPALHQGASLLSSAPANFVRRVVLISDGVDGSGATPHTIHASVQAFAQQGIAFSALGIGSDYDESFLTNVADAGHGGYAFLATGGELQPFLQRELDHASNTVVDGVVATFELPEGWRVSRGFGFVPEMHGMSVNVPIGQIASGETRKAILELRGPSGPVGFTQSFGVQLQYRTVADSVSHRAGDGALALHTVASSEESIASRNAEVYARSQAVAIDYDQREAIDAWRSGDTQRAAQLAQQNQGRLEEVQAAAPASLAGALRAQEQAMQNDLGTIQTHQAGSAEGRAYGLHSNSLRRGRAL